MRLREILTNYQNYLLLAALVLSSIAISIRAKDGEINLVLENYPVLIFLMVVCSSILVAVYFGISRRNTEQLTRQIRDQGTMKSSSSEDLLLQLTERQREVYDLIVSGMSNKEIMSELFIEQSTLKSHINQIYRKLNIKNRRQLKSGLKK